MSNTKYTPENREIRTAVEQGQLALIMMRRHTVVEAAFQVMLHERSYHDTKTIPAPLNPLLDAKQGVAYLTPATPEAKPLNLPIQDVTVYDSERLHAPTEAARLKVQEALLDNYEFAA